MGFESRNRSYFEAMVPSRRESYYVPAAFGVRHRELLKEQDHDLAHFYLIRNDAHRIAGRINLVDIDKAAGTAHIGFRVGEDFAGKGVAGKATKLLLEKISDVGVAHVYAKTTTENIASQRVLERNGFSAVSIGDEVVQVNGREMRFINYIWKAPL